MPPANCMRSEEHTSELQSRGLISYAVFCLKKKNWIKFPGIGQFQPSEFVKIPVVLMLPKYCGKHGLVGLFFCNDTATTEIYTLSLHVALPICTTGSCATSPREWPWPTASRRCGRRSEEHTSELQSRGLISYAVFCLKKKK